MIKSTAVVLGLLFVIASTYYLVFWGHFDVDIFQYMEISSIIKGLIYPLRTAAIILIWIIVYVFVASCYIFFSERNSVGNEEEKSVEDYERRIRILIIIWAVLSVFSLPAIICHILSLSDEHLRYAVSSSRIALPTIAMTIMTAYCVVDNKIMLNDFKQGKKEVFAIKNSFYKSIDYFFVAVAAYLFAAAFSYGVINSKKIENHISYDYVRDTSFLEKEGICPDNVVVYLGAINDKYFFRDYAGGYIAAVDKWKIPVLLLSHHEELNADLDLFDSAGLWLSKHPNVLLLIVFSMLGIVILFLLSKLSKDGAVAKKRYLQVFLIIKLNRPRMHTKKE